MTSAAPTQYESAESQQVAWEIRTRWYRNGVTHIEHAIQHPAEAARRAREGTTPGLPDWTLEIPGSQAAGQPWFPCVRAVCELKARLRNKTGRPGPEAEPAWWLQWRPWENTQAWENRTTWGLRGLQAWHLQRLARLGYATHVAYGAEDLLAFFDRLAGPARWVDWIGGETDAR